MHTAYEKKGPVAQLMEQFDEKSKDCKNLQQEYLRAVADFDNLRKRTERDSEISRRVAMEALVMDLLPVMDNFERAVQSAEAGANAESMKKGMELIHRQLRDALCRHGVEEYSCVGTEFDTRRAEAISFVHTEEHKPGTVVTEVAKGYSAGERVLRPAKVVVAKAPERVQVQVAGSETSGQVGSDEAEADDKDAEVEVEKIDKSGYASKQ
jgi:molecular chaperone GrpE